MEEQLLLRIDFIVKWRKNGLDSKMLVAFQGIRSRQEGVYQFSIRKKLHHKVNVMINQLLYPASKIIGTYSFAFNGCDLSKENDIREADFIYLHWIYGNAFYL